MLNLVAVLLLGAPVAEPSVAAVVGLRADSHYWTAVLRPAPSQGYVASVSRGLLVPSHAGLMFVDVVPGCSHEDPQGQDSPRQRLSIERVTGRIHPAPCEPSSEVFDRPRLVTVLHAGHRYISVHTYGESWNGRGFWSIDTRAWGEESPLPMERLLPNEAVSDLDIWAAQERERGISRALSEGLTGDADPCWHPDPNHDSWAITRSDRRWVVMVLLQSSCTTDTVATPIAVPDALVDGSRNRDPGVALATRETPYRDFVVSPDGRLAVLTQGNSLLLGTLENGALAQTMVTSTLPVPDDTAEPTFVMVQWFESDAFADWLPMLREAMSD